MNRSYRFIDCLMAIDVTAQFRIISFGLTGDDNIDEQDIFNHWFGGDLVFDIPKEIEHEAEPGLWKCDMLFTWIGGSFDSDGDSIIEFENYVKLYPNVTAV